LETSTCDRTPRLGIFKFLKLKMTSIDHLYKQIADGFLAIADGHDLR